VFDNLKDLFIFHTPNKSRGFGVDPVKTVTSERGMKAPMEAMATCCALMLAYRLM